MFPLLNNSEKFILLLKENNILFVSPFSEEKDIDAESFSFLEEKHNLFETKMNSFLNELENGEKKSWETDIIVTLTEKACQSFFEFESEKNLVPLLKKSEKEENFSYMN